jgi:glycosyltransferase involved in cell wall biosynthesis
LIKALDASEWRNRIQLVFLGHLIPGDPYSLEFEKLIADRSWCHHGGFADRDGLKRQLETAALVVLPSLEDNCPMVVLEAMAAGTPVLAARVGGLPDLIDPGVNGLFCDPQDPKSIRTGVETLLENREEAALMARQAHSMAQARFSPLTVARQHLDIYREVLRH